MNIQIRVLSGNAQKQIRALEAEIATLQRQLNQTNNAARQFGAGSIRPITRWGNQIQWAGRQLQYNFTLPIVLAGAAATKFALDNEKAMVRVKKVYGDGSEAMNQLATKEIPALEKAFIALSNRFGVAQADTINIAADWAAAGASGVALAKSVKLTMETMVLGEMNAKEATEALIAIQAQYNLDTKELIETIDTLNMVENQTGISMIGLVQGMSRAAGVAREMGVDVQHLSAMMAALVPATGSAAAAGNGLKTILSRIMSPTNEANEVMAKMGINTKELAWQSLNATQRLEKMAKVYTTLDDAQKIVVTTTAASRWQINRLGQLFTDINNPLGYYHRSLEATADTTKNFNQRVKELNTVLSSSPQRLKQIWVILQNTMANIIQPMIPVILILGDAIADLAKAYGELSPTVQKLGLALLFMLAAIGPLVRYMGSVAVLLGVMQEGFAFLLRIVGATGAKILWLVKAPFKYLYAALVAIPALLAKVGPALLAGFAKIRLAVAAGMAAVATGPGLLVVAAVAAALGVLYAFKDEIQEIFSAIPEYLAENAGGLAIVWSEIAKLFSAGMDYIIEMFWKLPESVRDALLTVLRIVQTIALKIYEWLSYINPFARHSPSLVDQVTDGVAVIKAQYASLGNMGGIFSKAARDIEAYKRAIGTMGGGAFSDERSDVAASFKSALPIFDALIGDLTVLNKLLAQQEAQVAKQQIVVDAWEASLDAVNVRLDVEERKLDALQATLDVLNETYAQHQEAMDNYASAPIEGMMAMEDQIFANQQAQNALRLEMLRWEEVNGSIEDVQSNMSALAGSMERLRAEATDLRNAGAGSDVLGPMQDELEAMQTAYDQMGDTANSSPVAAMQAELARLAREGEILDLEKSLNFDGMIREIDKLVNAQAELSFEEIVAGINDEKAAMAALKPSIDAATEAVKAQELAVNKVKLARDAIAAIYDVENAKLQVLKNSYDQTADAIRNIESALNDMGGAAATAIGKANAAKTAATGYQSPGAQNFDDAAGGNFPDVSGHGAQIGREGGLEDQSALIDQFTKDTVAEMETLLGEVDLMKPFKEKWDEFQGWWTVHVERNWIRISNTFKEVWDDLSSSIGNSEFASGASGVWDKLVTGGAAVWDFLVRLKDLFKDDLMKIWKEIREAAGQIFEKLGPELAKFGELMPGLMQILGYLWVAFKGLAGLIGGLLVGAFKIITSILAHTLGPAFDIIIGVVENLIRIFRGLVEFIVGVFTGDIDRAVQGILDIFWGLVHGIWEIIKGGWNLIWGAVEGLANGVIDWIQWLYDVIVGHSIIPDMILAIVEWFAKLPQWVLDAIKNLITYIRNVVSDAWEAFKSKSTEKWNEITSWLKERGKAAYIALVEMKAKLSTVSAESWDKFKATAIEKWTNFINWIKGLGQSAYINLIHLKGKLIDVAKAAFTALTDEAKKIVDGKGGLMGWIGGIPGRVAGLLGSIGTKVADSVKASWNSAAKWINDNGIGAINKVTTKFGFTLKDLPRFAGGGVIPGKVSKRDNTIIAARTGEGVIVPELVQKLGGAKGLAQLNNAARTGNQGALAALGVERFADGGIIGKVSGWLASGAGNALGNIIGAMKKPVRDIMPGKPFMEDWAVGALQGWQDKAKAWGDKQESMGNGVLPGTGYQWQTKVLKNQFPNAVVTSGFRPGAMTASGYTSMHALGRAIDISPSGAIFDWIYQTYGKNTRELFYGPKNGKNIRRGQDVTIGGALLADHWDHIHWGYDKGGILPPGLTMARNNTGMNEYTITAQQFRSLSNVAALLERMTLKSMGATPGAAAVTRLGTTLGTVEARLRAAETRSLQTTRSGGGSDNSSYHFHGDLSFPNVKNGSDAEDFLKNLKGLGG